ncbi:MAG: Jag N-terminal domain-containing protein [Eubacteriales bacterium]|nr:Jag N-terminal domain-containing protein [Eubacteriales bacterium]
MSFVEKQAKTVDQAIELALAELNASAEEVLIEVLDEGESGGLLGFGRRPAKVRVTMTKEAKAKREAEIASEPDELGFTDYREVNEPEDYRERLADKFEKQAQDISDQEPDSKLERNKQHDRRQRNRDRRGDKRRTDRQGRQDRSERKLRNNRRQGRNFAQHEAKSEDKPERKYAVLSKDEQKVMEERCLDFLAAIFSGLEIHGTMASFYDDEGVLHVEVDGDELGHAIGRGGENLEAIQYLTTLAMNKGREDYFRVLVDIGKYREKNSRMLRQRAEDAAYRALDTGRQQSLPPMSASDRRVVHLTVASIEGVYSLSQGEEPRRRVLIRKSQ